MSALKVIQVPAAFNTAGLNIVWILVGLIAIYAGIKNLLDEENPSRIGTAIFWCSFGIVTALGTWLPAKVSGVLVIIMCLPPIFKKVKVGKTNAPEKAHTEAQFKKIGMKIFVPAFCVAVFSLAFSLFSNMSSMIAITLGVLVAIIFLGCIRLEREQTAGFPERFRAFPFPYRTAQYAAAAAWLPGRCLYCSRCW